MMLVCLCQTSNAGRQILDHSLIIRSRLTDIRYIRKSSNCSKLIVYSRYGNAQQLLSFFNVQVFLGDAEIFIFRCENIKFDIMFCNVLWKPWILRFVDNAYYKTCPTWRFEADFCSPIVALVQVRIRKVSEGYQRSFAKSAQITHCSRHS